MGFKNCRSPDRVLGDLERLCKYISKSITPNSLKITLICHTNMKAATEIAKLLLTLPPLREFAIDFDRQTDIQDPLLEIARSTAMKITGRISETPHRSFRYQDLPREIQLRILDHTDLMCDSDIGWTSGWTIKRRRFLKLTELKQEPKYLTIDPLQFACCQNCCSSARFCCCWTISSSFSTSCTCWKAPTAMFAVSRQLRTDSLQIFFQRNHFISLPQNLELERHGGHLTLCEFLVDLPNEARQSLRSLTWMPSRAFDDTETGYYQRSPIYSAPKEDWHRAIKLLGRADTSKLSFSVDLTARQAWFWDSDRSSGQSGTFDTMYEVFEEIKMELRLLKNFFLYLDDDYHDHIDSNVRAQEVEVEKSIMGQDTTALQEGNTNDDIGGITIHVRIIAVSAHSEYGWIMNIPRGQLWTKSVWATGLAGYRLSTHSRLHGNSPQLNMYIDFSFGELCLSWPWSIPHSQPLLLSLEDKKGPLLPSLNKFLTSSWS